MRLHVRIEGQERDYDNSDNYHNQASGFVWKNRRKSQPAAQPCESETKKGLEKKAAIPMSKTVTLTMNALLVFQRAVYLNIRAPRCEACLLLGF